MAVRKSNSSRKTRKIRRSPGLLATLLQAIHPGSNLGRRGEAAAARYLRRRGLKILSRNFRARSGEIDLVALDRETDTIVFVEVKSTLEASRGDPLERIHTAKARRIRRAAALCRRWAGWDFPRSRMDGVVVDFVRGFAGRPVPASIRWYPALYPVDDLD